jgi:hypothetical protein
MAPRLGSERSRISRRQARRGAATHPAASLGALSWRCLKRQAQHIIGRRDATSDDVDAWDIGELHWVMPHWGREGGAAAGAWKEDDRCRQLFYEAIQHKSDQSDGGGVHPPSCDGRAPSIRRSPKNHRREQEALRVFRCAELCRRDGSPLSLRSRPVASCVPDHPRREPSPDHSVRRRRQSGRLRTSGSNLSPWPGAAGGRIMPPSTGGSVLTNSPYQP